MAILNVEILIVKVRFSRENFVVNSKNKYITGHIRRNNHYNGLLDDLNWKMRSVFEMQNIKELTLKCLVYVVFLLIIQPARLMPRPPSKKPPGAGTGFISVVKCVSSQLGSEIGSITKSIVSPSLIVVVSE